MNQILGRLLNEFVDPADCSAAESLLINVQDQPVKQRLVFADADGRQVPAPISANLLNQPDGLSICVVATGLTELENSTQMIQQLRRRQEALRESEERFRLLVEGVKDYAIFMLDPAGRVISWNAGAQRIKGWTGEEIIGQSFSRFYVPEVAASRPQAELEHAGAHGSFEDEGWRIRKDGSRFWASVTITALRGADGSVRSFAKIMRDITERRHADEALREQAALLNLIHDAIIVRDAANKVVFWNPGAEETYGWKPEEAMGRAIHDLLKTAFPKSSAEIAVEVAEKGYWEGELTHIRKDGQAIAVASRWAVRRDESGRQVGVLEINRDITERRRQEEEVRRANEKLEEQVRERTEQLRALAGELTLTEQRERKRLAKVLHDHIQQLLVAAKFRVAVLSRDERDTVKQAVKEIGELIDESITASRSLTAELSPPVLHKGGLNAGLEWFAKWMKDKQHLHVDLGMDAIEPLTEVTNILLFESVRELLLNVVKHSNTHSVRVSLRSAEGLLQLVVSDDGVGFDPKLLSQAGESGAGYRLFTIRESERLHLMGGRVEIDSAPGKGSRFVLHVPLVQDLTRIAGHQKADSSV
jgi:PAS domain S-box-containing protein